MERAAPLLGVSRETLAKYERGESIPEVDFLRKLADISGVSLRELLQARLSAAGIDGIEVVNASGRAALAPGLAEPAAAFAGTPAGFVFIPRYDIEASAGPGAFADRERVLDHMAFRDDWVRRALGVDPARLVLLTAIGDSMEDAIRAGDLLLVDTAVDRIIDDAIYVVVDGDALMVKRVQRLMGGGLVIKSDNTDAGYEPQRLHGDAAGRVVVAGRVRWIGRLI